MNPLAQIGAIDGSSPLFLQIAEQVEDSIVDGNLAEEDQAPSTNELAAFYRVNPATAAKGLNLLVDKGVLYKRRGIGMFVTQGARAALLAERRACALRHEHPDASALVENALVHQEVACQAAAVEAHV